MAGLVTGAMVRLARLYGRIVTSSGTMIGIAVPMIAVIMIIAMTFVIPFFIMLVVSWTSAASSVISRTVTLAAMISARGPFGVLPAMIIRP